MGVSTKAGADGFWWFIGVVEDRDDPLKMGRVRVRVYNAHPQKTALVKTGDLHWAPMILSPISAGHMGVGISPTGVMVGSTVFGFFADAGEKQKPVVLGTLQGVPGEGLHDVAPRARGSDDITAKTIGPEPSSAFAARYPYNKVMKTERGHQIEVDDTPGGERIHIYHRSGTYTEVNPEGRKVDKIVGDEYHVVAGNQEVFIQGNVNVRVQGNVNILVDGTYTLESKGNMTIKAPKIDLNP